MKDFVLECKVRQLKAMHELMLMANDEEIYMTWIYTVPDEPSEQDFIEIASDEKEYNEVFDLFLRLINDEGVRF
jgi:hypothetical protein